MDLFGVAGAYIKPLHPKAYILLEYSYSFIEQNYEVLLEDNNNIPSRALETR